MKKVPVGFWDADSVLKFVNIMAEYPDDVDLICGSCCVDAKSLLAVFSMKTAKNMELLIHGEGSEELTNRICSYIEYAGFAKCKAIG